MENSTSIICSHVRDQVFLKSYHGKVQIDRVSSRFCNCHVEYLYIVESVVDGDTEAPSERDDELVVLVHEEALAILDELLQENIIA